MLDRIFISADLSWSLINIKRDIFKPVDHYSLQIKINLDKKSMGSGIWKLNTSLLTVETIEDIKYLYQEYTKSFDNSGHIFDNFIANAKLLLQHKGIEKA